MILFRRKLVTVDGDKSLEFPVEGILIHVYIYIYIMYICICIVYINWFARFQHQEFLCGESRGAKAGSFLRLSF